MQHQSPIHRQWWLLKSLSSRRHGLTLREMAEDAGVNAKTMRRDLELFRALTFELEERIGEFRRTIRWLKSSLDKPPLGFRFDQALAIYLSRRRIQRDQK